VKMLEMCHYFSSEEGHLNLCMLLIKLHVRRDILKAILMENFGEQKLCAHFIPH